MNRSTIPACRCGIYSIEHRPSGRLYIGATTHLVRRRLEHKKDLLRGRHTCAELQRVFDADGFDALCFEPLFFCPPQELIRRERVLMRMFSPDTLLNSFINGRLHRQRWSRR